MLLRSGKIYNPVQNYKTNSNDCSDKESVIDVSMCSHTCQNSTQTQPVQQQQPYFYSNAFTCGCHTSPCYHTRMYGAYGENYYRNINRRRTWWRSYF